MNGHTTCNNAGQNKKIPRQFMRGHNDSICKSFMTGHTSHNMIRKNANINISFFTTGHTSMVHRHPPPLHCCLHLHSRCHYYYYLHHCWMTTHWKRHRPQFWQLRQPPFRGWQPVVAPVIAFAVKYKIKHAYMECNYVLCCCSFLRTPSRITPYHNVETTKEEAYV